MTQIKSILLLMLRLVLVYFIFGYFVAWQWEETRRPLRPNNL
jgi:hypothetical protein